MLDTWNRQDAEGYAHPFAEEAAARGFDGSEMGRAPIAATLRKIFNDHQTGTYVGKIREVRMLSADVWLLRGIAGVIPGGKDKLDPKLNSVQSLIVARRGGTWRIVLYHNTPAALHGRPEQVDQMTEELRRI